MYMFVTVKRIVLFKRTITVPREEDATDNKKLTPKIVHHLMIFFCEISYV